MNNFTCTSLKHQVLWSNQAIETFAPVYPTSIRGANDQRGDPGTR
jgi:hypothetical protein